MIQSADPRALGGGRHPLASARYTHVVPLGPGALPGSSRFIVLQEGWRARWAVTPSQAAFLHAMIAMGIPSET